MHTRITIEIVLFIALFDIYKFVASLGLTLRPSGDTGIDAVGHRHDFIDRLHLSFLFMHLENPQ